MNSPCLGCPKRSQMCHTICGEYKTYDAYRKRFLEVKRIEAFIDHAASDLRQRNNQKPFRFKTAD